MKISEMIARLEKIKESEGDLEVLSDDRAGADYDVFAVTVVEYRSADGSSVTKYARVE